MKKMKYLSMIVFTFVLTGFLSMINVKADTTIVRKVNLEVKDPVAGTVVTTGDEYQDPAPFVAPMEAGYTITTNRYRTGIPNYDGCVYDENNVDAFTECLEDVEAKTTLNGTIVEDQNYYVEVSLSAAEPDYVFDADMDGNNSVAITVNGKTTGFTVTDANPSTLTFFVQVTGVAASNDEDENNNNNTEILNPNTPSTSTVEEYWKGNNFKAAGEICAYKYIYNGQEISNYPSIHPTYKVDPETGMQIMDPNTHMPVVVEGKGEIDLQQFFPTTKANDFEITIKTNDLDADKNYVVSLKYDNDTKETKYTGAKLNKGITLKVAKAKGTAVITIFEEKTKEIVKYKWNACDGQDVNICNPQYAESKYFDEIAVLFNEQHPDLDKIFESIAKDGVIKLNSIRPSDEDFMESMITAGLPQVDGYDIYGYIDEDDQGILQIYSFEKGYGQNYAVKYEFAPVSSAAKTIVEEAVKKFKYTREEFQTDYNKRFVVEDLESINFLYNTQRAKEDAFYINKIVNYSSKIHELVGNANIDFIYDVRAGGSDSDFTDTFIGPMNVLYNGIVYRSIDPIGYTLTQIIYVPDNTEKTREAFIKAATDRISSYLKGVDVKITYGGKIADLDEGQYSWESVICDEETGDCDFEYHKLFDFSKSTGEWYKVKIGNKEYKYFIVADSSKMVTPKVNTKDVETNIYIATGSFDTPLDSKISVQKLSKDSEEYKKLAKKLDIIKELAFDLNLYSSSLNMYITELSDGSFKVYIPVDEATAKQDLEAVYVKEDGTIEKHPITIEKIGDTIYAVFETNHFSTYSIVKANSTKNPKTGDNVYSLIFIMFASLACLVYLSKKKIEI